MGLALTPEAEGKAAAVLAMAEVGHTSGNARLALALLNQVIAAQVRRVVASPEPQHTAVVGRSST